jgi:hypothetical protein
MGKVLGLLIVIVIIAVLVLSGGGGKIVDKVTGSGYADGASRRVTAILKDMSGGRSAESHLATTLWDRNVMSMDAGELDRANRAFADFRRPRSFDGPFSTYRVVSSEEVEGQPVKTALVTFEVNGKTHQWLVPEKSRIRWAGK